MTSLSFTVRQTIIKDANPILMAISGHQKESVF
jgi:hypothetical protein